MSYLEPSPPTDVAGIVASSVGTESTAVSVATEPGVFFRRNADVVVKEGTSVRWVTSPRKQAQQNMQNVGVESSLGRIVGDHALNITIVSDKADQPPTTRRVPTGGGCLANLFRRPGDYTYYVSSGHIVTGRIIAKAPGPPASPRGVAESVSSGARKTTELTHPSNGRQKESCLSQEMITKIDCYGEQRGGEVLCRDSGGEGENSTPPPQKCLLNSAISRQETDHDLQVSDKVRVESQARVDSEDKALIEPDVRDIGRSADDFVLLRLSESVVPPEDTEPFFAQARSDAGGGADEPSSVCSDDVAGDSWIKGSDGHEDTMTDAKQCLTKTCAVPKVSMLNLLASLPGASVMLAEQGTYLRRFGHHGMATTLIASDQGLKPAKRLVVKIECLISIKTASVYLRGCSQQPSVNVIGPLGPKNRRAHDGSKKRDLPRTPTHFITAGAPLEVVFIKPGDYWLVENSSGKRIRVTATPRESELEPESEQPRTASSQRHPNFPTGTRSEAIKAASSRLKKRKEGKQSSGDVALDAEGASAGKAEKGRGDAVSLPTCAHCENGTEFSAAPPASRDIPREQVREDGTFSLPSSKLPPGLGALVEKQSSQRTYRGGRDSDSPARVCDLNYASKSSALNPSADAGVHVRFPTVNAGMMGSTPELQESGLTNSPGVRVKAANDVYRFQDGITKSTVTAPPARGRRNAQRRTRDVVLESKKRKAPQRETQLEARRRCRSKPEAGEQTDIAHPNAIVSDRNLWDGTAVGLSTTTTAAEITTGWPEPIEGASWTQADAEPEAYSSEGCERVRFPNEEQLSNSARDVRGQPRSRKPQSSPLQGLPQRPDTSPGAEASRSRPIPPPLSDQVQAWKIPLDTSGCSGWGSVSPSATHGNDNGWPPVKNEVSHDSVTSAPKSGEPPASPREVAESVSSGARKTTELNYPSNGRQKESCPSQDVAKMVKSTSTESLKGCNGVSQELSSPMSSLEPSPPADVAGVVATGLETQPLPPASHCQRQRFPSSSPPPSLSTPLPTTPEKKKIHQGEKRASFAPNGNKSVGGDSDACYPPSVAIGAEGDDGECSRIVSTAVLVATEPGVFFRCNDDLVLNEGTSVRWVTSPCGVENTKYDGVGSSLGRIIGDQELMITIVPEEADHPPITRRIPRGGGVLTNLFPQPGAYTYYVSSGPVVTGRISAEAPGPQHCSGKPSATAKVMEAKHEQKTDLEGSLTRAHEREESADPCVVPQAALVGPKNCFSSPLQSETTSQWISVINETTAVGGSEICANGAKQVFETVSAVEDRDATRVDDVDVAGTDDIIGISRGRYEGDTLLEAGTASMPSPFLSHVPTVFGFEDLSPTPSCFGDLAMLELILSEGESGWPQDYRECLDDLDVAGDGVLSSSVTARSAGSLHLEATALPPADASGETNRLTSTGGLRALADVEGTKASEIDKAIMSKSGGIKDDTPPPSPPTVKTSLACSSDTQAMVSWQLQVDNAATVETPAMEGRETRDEAEVRIEGAGEILRFPNRRYGAKTAVRPGGGFIESLQKSLVAMDAAKAKTLSPRKEETEEDHNSAISSDGDAQHQIRGAKDCCGERRGGEVLCRDSGGEVESSAAPPQKCLLTSAISRQETDHDLLVSDEVRVESQSCGDSEDEALIEPDAGDVVRSAGDFVPPRLSKPVVPPEDTEPFFAQARSGAGGGASEPSSVGSDDVAGDSWIQGSGGHEATMTDVKQCLMTSRENEVSHDSATSAPKSGEPPASPRGVAESVSSGARKTVELNHPPNGRQKESCPLQHSIAKIPKSTSTESLKGLASNADRTSLRQKVGNNEELMERTVVPTAKAAVESASSCSASSPPMSVPECASMSRSSKPIAEAAFLFGSPGQAHAASSSPRDLQILFGNYVSDAEAATQVAAGTPSVPSSVNRVSFPAAPVGGERGVITDPLAPSKGTSEWSSLVEDESDDQRKPRWGNFSTKNSLAERERRSEQLLKSIYLPSENQGSAPFGTRLAAFPEASRQSSGGYWIPEDGEDTLPPPSAYEIEETAFMMKKYNNIMERLRTTGFDEELSDGYKPKIYDLTGGPGR